jgi:hypothetical protein
MMRKLTIRKHEPPQCNIVPTESHSDGQHDGFFPRALWALLSSLGFGEPPLFVGTPRLLCGNFSRSYLPHPSGGRSFRTEVDVRGRHERCCIEALAILRHEEDDQMEHSQYCHFPSHTRERPEVVVMPWEIAIAMGASPTK